MGNYLVVFQVHFLRNENCVNLVYLSYLLVLLLVMADARCRWGFFTSVRTLNKSAITFAKCMHVHYNPSVPITQAKLEPDANKGKLKDINS